MSLVVAILGAAAEELEMNGWCQRTAFDQNRASCALGAIGRASNRLEGDCQRGGYDGARNALIRFLGGPTDPGVMDGKVIFDWNDHPQRTKEQVVTVLRLCAKKEKEDAARV